MPFCAYEGSKPAACYGASGDGHARLDYVTEAIPEGKYLSDVDGHYAELTQTACAFDHNLPETLCILADST
jgi:hypothetical protein